LDGGNILALMSRSPSALSACLGIAVAATIASAAAASSAAHPAMPDVLAQPTRDGKFSGAVVVRGAEGVRFARGYGLADPFAGRRFTPGTPVDSGSLAKPVTAAAVLILARDGKIDLDAPVTKYLPQFPYADATVRHLLAHSAGLPVEQMLEPLGGKTNEMFVAEMAQRKLPPLFLVYCNLCYTTLALLIEKVSGKPYLDFVRERAALPAAVTIRPARLADWKGRGLGYRRSKDGKLERADSYENELFYGAANFSISAEQLARWGAEWWKPRLASIKGTATTPATIAGKTSGLSWGNWYCARSGDRCHYLGHHEGLHHMLYWDGERKISVAMVSNNTLSPMLQQRVQRAVVAAADNRGSAAARELSRPLPDNPVVPGAYKFPTGETVSVVTKGKRVGVIRGGITYLAFPVGSGIRYVPGLDVYVAGANDGSLHWLSLYEDLVGAPTKVQT
jgi:CubicO group peptidase (beta-lactamase class C family)